MVMIDPSVTPEKPSRGRMLLGTAILVIGQLAPVGVPLVSMLELGGPWHEILVGALAFVVPELFLLVAIAIWGKPGYLYLRARFFALLKRQLPPDRVGVVRYRIGLILFTLPLLFAWAEPYVRATAGVVLARPAAAIAGDVLFFASFFVLGGDFWDKFRSLFIRDAVVTFPGYRTRNAVTGIPHRRCQE